MLCVATLVVSGAFIARFGRCPVRQSSIRVAVGREIGVGYVAEGFVESRSSIDRELPLGSNFLVAVRIGVAALRSREGSGGVQTTDGAADRTHGGFLSNESLRPPKSLFGDVPAPAAVKMEKIQ